MNHNLQNTFCVIMHFYLYAVDVNDFRKGISLKVDIILRLRYKLAYFKAIVHLYELRNW